MYRLKITDHIILLLGVFVMMAPVVVAFFTSTHEAAEIHRNGLTLRWGDHFVETYNAVLNREGGFTGQVTGMRVLMNSLILGIGFAVGKIVLSMLAAYAIVYFRFRLGTLFFWMIFTTLLLPLEVRILPSYEVMHQLHLINTYTGLIVPLLASATGTFFFRQFFKSIPDELLEAARIDGAGELRIFAAIVLPLLKPIVVTLAIFTFLASWNDFMWPLIVLGEQARQTAPVALAALSREHVQDNELMMAGSVVTLVPVLALFFVLQRHYIEGLLLGSVKG
jgi:sn-glycerol 3-phosphate transport system permease protein